MMRQISYSDEAFGDSTTLIERAQRALEGIEFDSMVGTGLSGALVVPILARAMDKTFAIIRKDSDSSHATSRLEGMIGDSYIFVDDFVATGATRDRVVKAVERLAQEFYVLEPRFVGTYQYAMNREARLIPVDSSARKSLPGCTCGCNLSQKG